MNERRILLAENNPDHVAKLQELLVTLRYSVEVYRNGLDALRRLQEPDTPEMALLSATLTPMTGLEIALDIRRRSRRRQLWLMVMTETPSADEVAMATDAGVDELLVKPIDLQELRMRIRTGERVQSVYRELSDSAMALEFHSTHDPLTGAWRREAVLDLLFKETDRVQRLRTPLSILLLGMDGFTEISERRGYNDADKLLKAFTNRLRHQLRSYDMLGRYSDDQFIIAFPGCAGPDAQAKAERMRKAIAERPFMVEGNELFLTASIGVAESSGRSPLVVLREAERGFTTAKQQGRNAVYFFSEHAAQTAAPPEMRRKTVEIP